MPQDYRDRLDGNEAGPAALGFLEYLLAAFAKDPGFLTAARQMFYTHYESIALGPGDEPPFAISLLASRNATREMGYNLARVSMTMLSAALTSTGLVRGSAVWLAAGYHLPAATATRIAVEAAQAAGDPDLARAIAAFGVTVAQPSETGNPALTVVEGPGPAGASPPDPKAERPGAKIILPVPVPLPGKVGRVIKPKIEITVPLSRPGGGTPSDLLSEAELDRELRRTA